MSQDDLKTRKRKADEALIVAKILSSESIDDIHALTSSDLLDFLSRHPDPETHMRIVALTQKQLELVRFDEFKDRALADWKRIRSAIEHENTLVNHRLTWLLTSQGFLFTGFGVIYSIKKEGRLDVYAMIILATIAIVGMAISFKIFVDIEGANKQLSDLDYWWHQKYAPDEFRNPEYGSDIAKRKAAYEKKLQKWHPVLQGRGDRKFWLDKGLKVEITFLLAWLVILSGVVAKPLIKILYEANYEYSDGWYLIPAFLVVIFILAWRSNYNDT